MAMVLAVAAAVALAGCGGSSGAAQADQEYLSQLHDQIPNVSSFRSDTELVRLGDAACAEFSAGASFETVADQLEYTDGSLPVDDLGSVITAAGEDLCPRYRSRVS